jgi:transcriptional regulator with XRE-family HTH domain
MKKLGGIFRKEREKSNLLLREAAAKLEIDQAVLSKIERCERNATKHQLIVFSKLYNLDLKTLTIDWNSEKISDLLEGEMNKKEILQTLLRELK